VANWANIKSHNLFRPAVGAGLTILVGLTLCGIPMGEPWVNASYDYLFRFAARGARNDLVLIVLDKQPNDKSWDRDFHRQLLERLSTDGARLVVFDIFFRDPQDAEKDEALAAAMRRQKAVLLMADYATDEIQPADSSALKGVITHPVLPAEPFLSAARTNWGVTWLEPDRDKIVRRHWPFPAPGSFHSLPCKAALLAGAKLSEVPQKQWLRYYAPEAAWTTLSYSSATNQATDFFRNKIVFIGTKPRTTMLDGERDKFLTPWSRWSGDGGTVGGVEIMATAFLNLLNGEWLRRPSLPIEIGALVLSGAILGSGLCRFRPFASCILAAAAALGVTWAAVTLSHFTNYWFPWLAIVGGQVPCGLAWTLVQPKLAPRSELTAVTFSHPSTGTGPWSSPGLRAPDQIDAPDYELFQPAFGEGAYGKVWLVRNAIGQWQALKAVYESKFGSHSAPYDREFKGIQRYKPISDKHPGLLRVDFVSRKKPEGYFYYVMELGDSVQAGWERNPLLYLPRDLARVRTMAQSRRLAISECVRIGLALADALDFLHRQGLTHRDIKPSNIIFVRGAPKLADVGLVVEALPPGEERTIVGTPGYMPPTPEAPGTPQADIYGLGMVLYVILTGRDPEYFGEMSTTLLAGAEPGEFTRLKSIILRACDPVSGRRYQSAKELSDGLREMKSAVDSVSTARQ
jgi:CHASE2 domain-containing sensor protein